MTYILGISFFFLEASQKKPDQSQISVTFFFLFVFFFCFFLVFCFLFVFVAFLWRAPKMILKMIPKMIQKMIQKTFWVSRGLSFLWVPISLFFWFKKKTFFKKGHKNLLIRVHLTKDHPPPKEEAIPRYRSRHQMPIEDLQTGFWEED